MGDIFNFVVNLGVIFWRIKYEYILFYLYIYLDNFIVKYNIGLYFILKVWYLW